MRLAHPFALLFMALALACLACGDGVASEQVAQTEPGQLDQMNIAMAAKRLCSALFVSARDEAEARRSSVFTFLNERARQAMDEGELRFEVDGDQEIAEARWSRVTARAESA